MDWENIHLQLSKVLDLSLTLLQILFGYRHYDYRKCPKFFGLGNHPSIPEVLYDATQ